MLSEFRISNFLSFDEEQVFSMEAGKVRSNIKRVYTKDGFKLLKFMAVYGANASGKSNLVAAFDFAQSVIVGEVPSSYANCYCRVNNKNIDKPSHFEFTIKIGDKKYIYGFHLLINSGIFTDEYLKQYKYGTTYKTIFFRDIKNSQYEVDTFFKDDTINERLKIYAEDVVSDGSILFLRLMNQNKDSLYTHESPLSIYKKVYNWFKYKLSVNQPDRPVTGYSYLINSDSVEQISKLLSMFGTGVSKFAIADVSLEKVSSSIPKGLMQEIIDNLNKQKQRFDKKGISEIPSVILRSSDDNTMFIIQLEHEKIKCKTLEFKHEKTDAIFSLNEE